VKVLTNGGPGWASTTINVEVYKLFSQGFYARATAVELMLSIILFIGIVFIQSWFRKGEENLS